MQAFCYSCLSNLVLNFIRALETLNISNNSIGQLVPPEGWSVVENSEDGDGAAISLKHVDGRISSSWPEASQPAGAIALASGIKSDRVSQVLTALDVSSNCLYASGAQHIACAIPDCK